MGQFINTGYYPNGKTKIEVDFQLSEAVRGSDCIFGNYGADFSVLLYAQPNNTYFQFCGKDGGWQAQSTGVAIDTERHVMVIDVPKKTGTLYAADGTLQSEKPFNSTWTYDKVSNWPITILASCTRADGNAARQHVKGRIYGAKIWESEDGGKTYKLMRDYVPAVKGKAPGLYDKVNGVFVTNVGPSFKNLASGGELFEIDDDPCIISDGTAETGINTGFFWGPDARVEIDCAFDALSPYQMRIVGADRDSSANMAFYLNGAGNASWAFNKTDGASESTPVSTGLAADFRRRILVADQTEKKAYYILAENGVTNHTANIAGTPSADATVPLALFGDTKAQNGLTMTFVVANNSAKARIYGAKFYRGGKLVRDLVPLVKGGIPGFRDKVTGDFVTVDRDAILGGFSASPATPTEPDDGWVLTSDMTFDGDTRTTNYVSCIDTGYVPTGDTRLELDFAFNSDYPQSGWAGNGDWALFTARDGGANRFGIYFINTGHGLNMGNQLWKSLSPNLPRLNGNQNVRRTVIMDQHSGTAAIVTAGYTNATFTGTAGGDYSYTKTLKIGAYEGGTTAQSPLRVYGLKLYESGELKRSYEPRIKDGVSGLLDVHGDGGFVGSFAAIRQNLACGGAIRSAGSTDAYIESDGTQGIDTKYLMKGAVSRVECDFALTDARQINGSSGGYQQRAFGQDSGGGLLYSLYINGSGQFMFGYGNTFINTHGPYVAADAARHVAVIDGYNNRLQWINGGAAWGVVGKTYDISADAHNNNSTWKMGIFATPTDQAATKWRNPAKMRLHSFRVYETADGKETFVHEFLPYKKGDVIGLYDVKTGEVFTDKRGGNAFKIGGMGVDGAEFWIAKPKNVTLTKGKGERTISAIAAGAVSYRWTKNGEALEGGGDGDLPVAWDKRGRTDEYSVVPVYDLYGTEKEGDPVAFTVNNFPAGTVIIIR